MPIMTDDTKNLSGNEWTRKIPGFAPLPMFEFKKGDVITLL